MAWIRVDDKFSHGPKVVRAAMQLGGGKKARGRVLAVWLDMVSYCNLNLTDGFVPAYEVDGMADAKAVDVVRAMTVSDERHGPLVEPVDGGWQMRNYADYQPTRAEIETARHKTAERQKTWRERKHNGVTKTCVDGASQHPEPNRTEPDRTEPKGTEPRTERAEDPLPRTKAQNDAILAERGIVAPFSKPVYRHNQAIAAGVNHPGCDASTVTACSKGVCVPQKFARAWRQQLRDHADPDGYLREFVNAACAGMATPVGDDPFKLWSALWAAKHGTQVLSGKPSNGDATLAAARRVAAEFEREGA